MASSVVTALRAVDGKNRAIYEHETQPMGPLMRRADGSTMKDYVYRDARQRDEECADQLDHEPTGE